MSGCAPISVIFQGSKTHSFHRFPSPFLFAESFMINFVSPRAERSTPHLRRNHGTYLSRYPLLFCLHHDRSNGPRYDWQISRSCNADFYSFSSSATFRSPHLPGRILLSTLVSSFLSSFPPFSNNESAPPVFHWGLFVGWILSD